MRFVVRTVMQLGGISGLPSDPWRVVLDTPLERLDADWSKWLAGFQLDELQLHATVSMDQHQFAEVDTRTALANRLLDGTFGREDDEFVSESVADIRRKRYEAIGPGAWLIIDITGTDATTRDDFPEVEPEFGVSYDVVDAAPSISALDGSAAHAIHNRVIGAIGVAAHRPVHTRPVGRCWWYVRPDGRPHHVMRFRVSARATASAPLRPEAPDDIVPLLQTAESDSRFASALGAFGQSLAWDLDPSLEFLSAFTGLELLIKARTNAPEHPQSPDRRGLAKRFETLVGPVDPDCATFDRLYAERNGLAHEAQFTTRSADSARRLFDRQVRIATQLPSILPP